MKPAFLLFLQTAAEIYACSVTGSTLINTEPSLTLRSCGSESGTFNWIRIRNYFLDPELFFRIRIQQKIKEQINKALSYSF